MYFELIASSWNTLYNIVSTVGSLPVCYIVVATVGSLPVCYIVGPVLVIDTLMSFSNL